MSYAPQRMSRWPVRTLTVVSLVLAPAVAQAHVAPSEDTNYRYVKLTPMADRVRIAYTILIGQSPGRIARQVLDADRDRVVSEAEADGWAQDLGAKVLAELSLTLDGEPVPLAWSEVVAGMDDRSVGAGAFSLDLIAWACLPGPAARHEVELVDAFSLVPAGETEVKIADEPGVTVEVARIGAGEHGDLIGRTAQFQKMAMPLAEGLRVVYTADGATPLADGRCPAGPKREKATPRWPIVLGALLGAAVVIALSLRARAVRRAGDPGRRSRN
jgi:hypothetical protein